MRFARILTALAALALRFLIESTFSRQLLDEEDITQVDLG
jgi:hypothetical protein